MEDVKPENHLRATGVLERDVAALPQQTPGKGVIVEQGVEAAGRGKCADGGRGRIGYGPIPPAIERNHLLQHERLAL